MPWKQEADPYKIWLSEIILQQTRVAQGLPYFERFVAAYPTVTELAAAPDDEVMKLWEGLGYYSRARNLLKAARTVADELDGSFPDTYAGLLQLSGVGPYTAAAIASFAFGRQVAVLDGNVYRVLSRYAGDTTPIDTGGGRQHFQTLVDRALGEADAAKFNQAIMDFGALVCTPKQADCPHCPLADRCSALAHDRVYNLPVKANKTKRRDRFFHYLAITDARGRYLIEQRTAKDVWQQLYQFPLVEADTIELTQEQLVQQSGWPASLEPNQLIWQGRSAIYQHQLTHQRITAVFHKASWARPQVPTTSYLTISPAGLAEYALPRLLHRFLEDNQLRLDL